MKVEPSPTFEETDILPPKASVKFLQITKPRPTPSLLRFLYLLTLVNALNRVDSLSSSIPTPVSIIFI